MLVVTASRVPISAEALRGKARDTLRLTWEERRWTRRRVTTTGGREVALALPTGSVLEPGAIVAVEGDWYLAIEGRPEAVLTVTPRDCAEAVRIAFEVGNRHFPLALDGGRLRVPDDSAMTQLLSRLGVGWDRGEAVFDPVGPGQPHTHGAGAGHGASAASPVDRGPVT
jgi:urease accessory protein